ncbi:restriction endonuclease subunit S [Micromonospora sp. WMMD987]|uniref:restriction endonuclease subunit S n=1 Tax=Micromonospora sp. WMMD987 TaxID=3016089 RepID=UPI00249C321A|nr:restriction endonuclease subunit S [Micromonospora sp. WMMD987]WFE95800.1 restriction endonuclease subunit S [Micromonospora sp. WMMD987]
MSDWRTYALGDVAEVFDGPHATPAKTDEGPWFLSISSLNSGRLELSESAHLSEQDFERWTRRVTPSPGDVLFSYETRLGEAALMPPGIRAALGRRMGLLRPKRDLVEPRFLLLAYLSPEFQQVIRARKIHGATVDRIPLVDIPKWPIRVPDISTQRRISSVLGALDDKIVVGNRIVATADALRSALLKEAQRQGLDDFVTKPLSQVAEFINGRAFTKGATGHGRMVIRIAEINSGPGPSTVYSDIMVSEKYLARPGDILFSWSGSLTVARWFRPEAIVNQHIFKVIPRGGNPKWLAFEAVKSKLADYRAVAADKATTMGHIQRRHLDEEVVVPTPEAIDRLDPQAGNLWQRALLAEQESLTLAALRDSLLPELMSGRLRVKDAEKVVEEAV